MNYAELEEEQKERLREACRQYRGRKRKESGSVEAQRAREANRRSYAKKVGKPIPPKGNQYEEFDRIGKVKWSDLKEKWKEFEGKPLEKSINTPIFLT